MALQMPLHRGARSVWLHGSEKRDKDQRAKNVYIFEQLQGAKGRHIRVPGQLRLHQPLEQRLRLISKDIEEEGSGSSEEENLDGAAFRGVS